MRAYLWPTLLVLIAGLVTVLWWLGGETRLLYLDVGLWAVPLVIGGLVAIGWAGGIALGSAKNRAVSAARLKSERLARETHRTFVGRLDHELKNPVTALRMAMPRVTEPELAIAMRGQVDRLAGLVSELRKLSEIDDYPVAQEAVELTEVIDDVLQDVNLADRQVVVSLPRAPRPLPAVWGDRDLVFLALYNVVSNAQKYSFSGDTLEIRAAEERSQVRIEISDTGCGIPADEVNQVWGELARGAGVRHIPGHGLGLPMVSAVLRRLGGQCELSSIAGQGTTVVLRLPIAAGRTT